MDGSLDLYDPSTLQCRVGVRNFPPNPNQQELKNALTSHFEKYGKIVGKLVLFNRKLGNYNTR
jgi:hypothetical protein